MAATLTTEQKSFEVLTGLSSGPTGSLALGNVLPKIEQFVFYLGLGVCIIFVILAAYQYYYGEKDTSKQNTAIAQKSLTYAVVGFVLLLLLRVIFIILGNILGFTFDPSSITK